MAGRSGVEETMAPAAVAGPLGPGDEPRRMRATWAEAAVAAAVGGVEVGSASAATGGAGAPSVTVERRLDMGVVGWGGGEGRCAG